ncbi:hypothetical protein OHC33_009115 [Knufia fluminis]|uniref:TEL2-interacting protein 1 n=1 Tax=Knufia fluminis TaxID=191047 RepID=A0AAN8EBB1_9EURO|nr:hypothetical protein OHC33_009115 [Knufia fluminis]
MNAQRQQAFLKALITAKLKPPCVNLSSIALRFRTKDASIKDVLRALEAVRDVLNELAKSNQLDPKLAEYAFFPLAQQVFNEAKRLSPRCLEIAAESVTILVSYGYRQALVPELGKQLIILMSMLAGAGPSAQTEPATDELKIASFQCIYAVVRALAISSSGANVFEDQGTRNVVDQLFYLLLEAVTESPSDQVQVSASEVLLQLITVIHSRVFLASLLPRTASSLTKALKSSTKARRTQKVLTTNLKVLRSILHKTLADAVALNSSANDEKEALGESWLSATAAQVKNALIQVTRLRMHDSPAVNRALEELCVMVIEECRTTLAESVPIVLETLVILSAGPDNQSTRSTCRHLVIAYPETEEMLKTSFLNWSRSLPRLFQAQDERPKQMALQKLTAALPLLVESQSGMTFVVQDLMPLLLSGISNMVQDTPKKALELENDNHSTLNALVSAKPAEHRTFEQFILNHESQRDTLSRLRELFTVIRQSPEQSDTTRWLVNSVADTEGAPRLASFWLALQLLNGDSDGSNHMSMDDFLVPTDPQDKSASRSSLLADLHATTLPLLSSVFAEISEERYDWQLQALAIQTVTLYAETFAGDSYRPELMDTLYPVLSFLGSPNAILRSHAMTALDKLAQTCQYASTTDLLISNVDYLVNSIAWKLNTYSLSPEAPQILQMMVHLCGAELMPYLDDLIQSVFAALDSYHGYPQWVETLFSTLKAMVDVSIKQPQLAITQGKEAPIHRKTPAAISSTGDILDNLRARKRRKVDFDRPADEPPGKAPHRPWTENLDGPSFPKSAAAGDDDEDLEAMANDECDDKLAPMKPSTEEEEQKLSKSHTLLLNIATSTVPHLASPSPRVRHLLLDLLKDVSPLLSRDENSFLPLINAIWPVVVSRLFAEQGEEEETAYNIAAAADTMAVLCESAGDFMASRIEEIFQQLVRLFKKVRAQVNSSSTDAENGRGESHSKPGMTPAAKARITGPVNLEVVKPEGNDITPTAKPSMAETISIRPDNTRTSQGLVLSSLIGLLVSIIRNVRLTLDTNDEIMRMLLPLMDHKAGIREALEVMNEDFVWLWDLRRGSKASEIGLPTVRDALSNIGLAPRAVDVAS